MGVDVCVCVGVYVGDDGGVLGGDVGVSMCVDSVSQENRTERSDMCTALSTTISHTLHTSSLFKLIPRN